MITIWMEVWKRYLDMGNCTICPCVAIQSKMWRHCGHWYEIHIHVSAIYNQYFSLRILDECWYIASLLSLKLTAESAPRAISSRYYALPSEEYWRYVRDVVSKVDEAERNVAYAFFHVDAVSAFLGYRDAVLKMLPSLEYLDGVSR